jgi:hypothetical protein
MKTSPADVLNTMRFPSRRSAACVRVLISFILAGCCITLPGCKAMQHFAYNSRVTLYLSTNPNVQDDIKAGLQTGMLVKGMTKEEVTLCLGDPLKKEWTKYDAETETWLYTKSDNSEKYHALVSPDVPLKLAFTNTPKGFVLYRWGIVTQNKPNLPEPPRAVTNLPPLPKPPPPPQKTFNTDGIKIYSAKADTSAGWPELSLDGISKQGGKYWALINKTLVTTGDQIGGASIKVVTDTGVVIECFGEQRLLRQDPDKVKAPEKKK